MKLSFEQIKSITFGTARLWEDSGLHFRRCTASQIEAWHQTSEIWGLRSNCPTGVSFDFHTDSSRCSFLFSGSYHFDIHIDGILAHCHQATDPCCTVALPEGEHRVTVTFPSHSADDLRLLEAELDDGASLRPHSFDRKILFLGDSITQGWGTSRDSLSWAWNICFALNAECVNQGIGGTSATPSTFPLDLDFDPDTVIVAYGTNDWSVYPSLEKLKEKHDAYWDLVCEKYAGKRLIGISPTYRFHTEAGRKMGSFLDCCETVKQCIRDHAVTLVDGFDLIPHQELFFMDGLHPLDIGYRTFAENLLKYL